jgi:protoporphyrinogen oxidase
MREEGYTFDFTGSHIIFSRDTAVLGFMLSLLGSNAGMRERNTKIFYKGRLVKYPFENGLSGLPPVENLECLWGYARALASGGGKPANFREWLVGRFGKGIAEKYLIPYNEKIWNTPAEGMSTAWVEGRIPQPPFLDVLKSSLGLRSEGYTHQLKFCYPVEGGIQALPRALEARCKGNVRTGFRVGKVKKEGGKWVVSGSGGEEEFDSLVSTIPVHALASAMMGIPREAREAVSRLKFNSVATVMLGMGKPEASGISWMYFPGRELFNRVAFPSNFSAKAAPQGKSSLVAEVTFREGDEVSRMGDESLCQAVIGELHEDKIIDKAQVEFSAVRRTRHAYVLHDLEYEESSAAAREYFASQGIVLCGRFSEFRYLNMDACIRSAQAVSGALNAGGK